MPKEKRTEKKRASDRAAQERAAASWMNHNPDNGEGPSKVIREGDTRPESHTEEQEEDSDAEEEDVSSHNLRPQQ